MAGEADPLGSHLETDSHQENSTQAPIREYQFRPHADDIFW